MVSSGWSENYKTYSSHHLVDEKLYLSLFSALSELGVYKFLMINNARKANEFFKFLVKETRSCLDRYC